MKEALVTVSEERLSEVVCFVPQDGALSNLVIMQKILYAFTSCTPLYFHNNKG